MPTPLRHSAVRLALAAGFVVVLLPALASPVAAQGVRIRLPAWPESVLLDTLRQNHELHAPPETVYQAVLKAFGDLGIPTGQTDGKTGIIGSERFERTRSFLGAPLSRSYECGDGPAGPYADFFRLEIAVAVWVEPLPGGGTKLGIATVASARDVSGASRDSKTCSSSGSVETKVFDRVSKIVGG